MMDTFLSCWAWVKSHPMDCVQYLLIAWAVANVVWAQWPKPKSDKAQAVWKLLHHVFQLIATTAKAQGTFTWPSLIRAIIGGIMASPDPFADQTPKLAQPAKESGDAPQ